MNTNSNIYTVIYTTIVVILVAAILAFVSQKLGPMQAANEKAENISQILTAAQFGDKDHWKQEGNAATIEFFKENIETIGLYNGEGELVGNLDCTDAQIYSVSDLKAQNYIIKKGDKAALKLPAYGFKNGITVVPIYGAGLWGPVWGYLALNNDFATIEGAYFDHESETPGLGGKIKDDPSFRESFIGEILSYGTEKAFGIIKGGSEKGNRTDSKVDAITGATMTSKGLDAAINSWVKAFEPALKEAAENAAALENQNEEEETSNE